MFPSTNHNNNEEKEEDLSLSHVHFTVTRKDNIAEWLDKLTNDVREAKENVDEKVGMDDTFQIVIHV